jgi:ubiquinone/menaquinone biosynthesis C-methylase UbiE
MTHEISWATPLYKFLRLCNASPLEKVVLDCGAGGDEPPLALFFEHGYRTYGLEIQEGQWSKARRFCDKSRVSLQIIPGDMRHIPFPDQSFSFVYSYNAIFFMTKAGIARAMGEILRVLKPGGLCFVNFLSVDDPDWSPFCDTAPAKRLLQSERFAHHEDDEADRYFAGCRLLWKEKRVIDKFDREKPLRQVYIDYIAERAMEAA